MVIGGTNSKSMAWADEAEDPTCLTHTSIEKTYVTDHRRTIESSKAGSGTGTTSNATDDDDLHHDWVIGLIFESNMCV